LGLDFDSLAGGRGWFATIAITSGRAADVLALAQKQLRWERQRHARCSSDATLWVGVR
jgi:hypothetical protein